MALQVFLILMLFIPAALEGIGITFNRYLFLWFYILFPVLLYFITLLRRAKLHIPRFIALVTIPFLILSGIASFRFSVDRQNSAELFLFFCALFLIFVFSYSNKDAVRRFTPPLVIILGIFFTLYSLGLQSANFFHISLPSPLLEKQFVFAMFGGHNNLGDFLGLVLIFLFGIKPLRKKRLLFYVVTFLLFILIIVSNSRSAYLSLFAVLLFALISAYRNMRQKQAFVVSLALVILLFALFITSSRDVPSHSIWYALKTATVRSLHVVPRDLWSGRDAYFGQSFRSIASHPFFGIGGGNFIQASQRFDTTNNFSDSSHNILLDIATEQGLPALLFFVSGIILVTVAAIKKKGVEGFALIYLLINFQTNYTFQIYLLPVIAVLLAGIIYEEKKPWRIPAEAYGLLCLLLFGAFSVVLTSALLVNEGRPKEALAWYPFNKWAYIQAIQDGRDRTATYELIGKADAVAPEDSGILLASAQKYREFGDTKKAYTAYEAMYAANRYVTFSVIEELFTLKKELFSEKEALRFLGEVAGNYKYMRASSSFKREFADFCIRERGERCMETDWYWSSE